MSYPVLYSFRRCPYAMRARLALLVSGVTCELREVVLRDKPQKMLDLSPKGTVPVLETQQGEVIDQSFEIMLWALNQNDPQDWLDVDKADLQKLVDQNDGPFKAALDCYKYETRYENVNALDERAKAQAVLQDIEQRLVKFGYLLSDRATIADFAILPFIRQFAHVDLVWFESAPYPKLRTWLSDFKASVLFQDVMKKYPQWHAGDPITLFKR